MPLPPLRLKTELAQDGPPPHGAYAPADFYRSANVVIVGLPMVLDLGCAPQPREDQAAELTPERAEELLVGQMQRAQSIYKLFLDWVRSVAGPGWGDDAYLLADEPVRARLLDDEGWPLSRGSATTERFRSRPARLTAASALGLMDSAVSGAAPPLASLLLAEALDNGFGRQAPDFRVAVLLGAIACEVGIKQALQQAATPEQQDLLQLVIDKPRDVSLSAVSLYDSPSRIVLGRSLREDNKALYKRLSALFEDRNRIAHRGMAGLRDRTALEDELRAAAEVLHWLDPVLYDLGPVWLP